MLRLAARLVAVIGLALALAGAAPAPSWTLHTMDGRAIGPRDFAPRWALLFLGYTNCADLCPAALGDLAEIVARLGAEAERVQPVFVSIDPDRDTPELLARYVESFATTILPLTASEAELRSIAGALGYHFVRYVDPQLAGDSFDHTASFFLLDPEGRLAGDFPTELAPAEIAAGIRDRITKEGASP